MDANPQGSMTASLGYIEPDEIKITLANKLMDIISEEETDPCEGILHHAEGVDLVPANIELSALELSLINVLSRERILRSYIDTFRESYDYIRRMALNGYVIHLDLSDIKKILRLMQINGNNLNQYTKKANQTGNVYQEDVEELLLNQRKMLFMLGDILELLSKIP